VCFCFLFGLALGGISSAGEPAKTLRMGEPVFIQNVAPSAADPVKVVDAFSSAIKAVKFSGAEKLLGSKVLILASGSSEPSRSEYMEHHAIEDPIFMQNAHRQLRYRQT
jgi:hypothetical protein